LYFILNTLAKVPEAILSQNEDIVAVKVADAKG
jgi:hypothetical protein